VVNDTRVLPARLRLRRDTGGAVEVLLLEPVDRADTDSAGRWLALVRPSRRVPCGTSLSAGDDLVVTVEDDLGDGRRVVRLDAPDGVLSAVSHHGEMPLPPYLTTPLDDPERYQTVYSDRPASAAAPTAGLHLTEEVLDDCRAAGARIERLELVVGLDTFRPVTVENLDDHEMHTEAYSVPPATLDACREADRVIAVGTTTVRALESVSANGPTGRTDLFIRPGYEFGVVDVLMTNYHLPGSTLLVMLEAFVGPRWRDLYALALAEGYRFLSFGDAMFVSRATP
jgi:S-adenosylmethionine:tRNA ribosyltransferase-isomerase